MNITLHKNPLYDSSAQNTGVQEILSFTSNGLYTDTKNGIAVNSGTYKNVVNTFTDGYGNKVSVIFYSNTHVQDSVAFYSLANNNDSLIISLDNTGFLASESKHYGRK